MTASNESPERWAEIPGFPGYEVSTHGRVLSRRRLREGTLLKASPGPCGFHTVSMSALVPGGPVQRVGNLAALAFIGPPPSHDTEVRRLDGNPLNDRLENLAYGTLAEVRTDHAARARREEANGAPTHCPTGHRYADSWLASWGERDCPGCRVPASVAAKRARLDRVEASCIDCGAPVGRRFKRCPDCNVLAQREAERRYRAKAVRRPRLSTCEDCGTEVLNRPTGPKARRCADCRRTAHRAADRRYRERGRSPRAELPTEGGDPT